MAFHSKSKFLSIPHCGIRPLGITFALLALFFSPAFSKTKPFAATFVTVHEEADQLEYDDKTKIMHLSGHVRLTQGDMLLEADEATYYLNTEEAEAIGNLKLTRPDGVLTGHHLHLYYREKRAMVDGNVTLVRFPQKGEKTQTGEPVEETPVQMTADELEYSWGDKVAVARGNVTVTQDNRKASADNGRFDELAERMEMEGHVHLFRPPKDELECDHLVYFLKSDQAKAEGHVKGKFLVQQQSGKKKSAVPSQATPSVNPSPAPSDTPPQTAPAPVPTPAPTPSSSPQQNSGGSGKP